jgi:zinc protease
VSKAYGQIAPSQLPLEDVHPEPAQLEERVKEVEKPTPTEKVTIGFHGPAFGDWDHPILSLLIEVLFGGRASRLHKRLVRDLEIASEIRSFVGPFKDPGLLELFLSAREGHKAEELVKVLDEELERVKQEPIEPEEIERARARFELGLLAGLDTMDGKASTIGFHETLLGRPGAAFDRLDAIRLADASELRRVARRYFDQNARSLVYVRSQAPAQAEEAS